MKLTRKKTAKFICLCLVAAMSVTAAASCSGDGSNDDKETGTGTVTTAPNEDEDDVDALVAELYGNKNYNGQVFRILAIEAGQQWYTFISVNANEVWFEDAGSDVLQKAIYERNKKTEDLIGIEIKPVWGGGADDIYEKVNQDASAGTDDFDAALLSLATAMNAAQNGSTLNLADISAFDSSHSWWNEQFVKDCMLFGEDIYTIAGAINIWDDCSNNIILFNKNLLELNNCTTPYQEVFDGTWTVESFMTRARAVTNDLNGDTDYDENDSWGIGTYGNGVVVGLQGFNSGIAHMNSEGIPEIIVNTEENIEKCKYWFDNVTNSDCFYNEGVNGDIPVGDLFEEGQIGFNLTNLTHPFDLREMKDEYGILPNPKYDSAQEKYTSSINTSFCTSYIIPKNCSDPEMAAVCLEVMSGYSVNTLDYNLHNILFESKLTRDAESREILEIIKDTISFDWSGIGFWGWQSNLTRCFDMSQGMQFNLASSLASSIAGAQVALDEMIAKFENLRK